MNRNSNERNKGPEREAPLIPEIVERQTGTGGAEWGTSGQPGDRDGVGRQLFGPRSFAGGRVQVYGCSPGCLIASLLVSVLASVVLTLLLNAIF